MSCVWVGTGCTPALGYITVDSLSKVMQPTFCMYRDPYFQERLSVGSITVEKKLSASDEKKRWEERQTVWQLKYKSSDNFLTLLNYGIAFCYAKLAETEGDSALYVKAEVAAKESYQTAVLPSNQADPLYLWGYILFKQERYEEARAKFEALLGILRHNRPDGDFPAKTFPDFVDDTAEALYGLGKVYLQLGDKAAAQNVFTQHLKYSPDSSYRLEIERLLEKQ